MLETNVLFRKIAIGNQKLKQLTPEDIKQVQRILLGMLEDFDGLCRKYGLRYCLCGGTAIGAVRHGGYIPWDEDIDIAMPRKDYDCLERLVIREMEDKYWVQNVKSSEKYDLDFMKIRKKGTKYAEVFESEPEFAGIFIDIYPLENTYDFWPARQLHGIWVEFLYFCASCVRIYEKTGVLLKYVDSGKARIIIRIKTMIGKLLSFFPLSKWCLLADRWSAKCRNEKSRFISIPSGRKHYFGEMYTRKSFFPAKEIEFEGKMFYIMAEPDEYLTKLYGDYMKIPPVNERERHSILELNIGETEC